MQKLQRLQRLLPMKLLRPRLNQLKQMKKMLQKPHPVKRMKTLIRIKKKNENINIRTLNYLTTTT